MQALQNRRFCLYLGFAKIYRFIEQRNKRAQSLKWTIKSVAKIMAYAEAHNEAA